jgi:hypothetical protein
MRAADLAARGQVVDYQPLELIAISDRDVHEEIVVP